MIKISTIIIRTVFGYILLISKRLAIYFVILTIN